MRESLTPSFFVCSPVTPVRRVQEKREPLVVRANEQSNDAWLHVDVFEGRGLAEFVFIPLVNADDSTNVVSFARPVPAASLQPIAPPFGA